MYAVKPWGKVLLVGAGVGTYAMGIGMRWRESYVHVIEKRADPRYELSQRRRCVLTNQTLKLLTDLGCTAEKLHSVLRPTRGWRFVTPELDELRSSTIFPGCADGEVTYHCQEGTLLRILRSEFMRFGGSISWATEAFDAFPGGADSDGWSLRKMFGLETEAEAIITTAKNTELSKVLFAEDSDRMAILFDELTGVLHHPEKNISKEVFGTSDVVVVVGCGLALHLWHTDDSICWRMIRRGKKRSDLEENPLVPLHPVLRKIVENSIGKQSRVRILPATTPAIKDSATHAMVSVLGDGLLQVDPFEWRGDHARCLVEEASALCRAFYGKKYHRANVAHLLRGLEQDFLAKRASLLRRDLEDAEHFLAMHPAIAEESDGAECGRILS